MHKYENRFIHWRDKIAKKKNRKQQKENNNKIYLFVMTFFFISLRVSTLLYIRKSLSRHVVPIRRYTQRVYIIMNMSGMKVNNRK